MKSKGFCAALAVICFLMQIPLSTVNAEGELPETAFPSESVSETSSDAETTASEPEEYTIPSEITGDASVNMGSHTINAASPVVGTVDYMVQAKSAFAYDLTSDTLAYAHNADAQVYPASTTKIVTCIVALENGVLSDIVTVDGEDISYLDESGSGVGLEDGEEMSLKNLLFCLMVESANDAAVVIANHIAGSEDAFVELMNEKVLEIGCSGTHFANSHGLHDENHYTTARDMALLMQYGLKNEMFRTLTSTSYYTVPETNLSEERVLFTTNYLMSEAISQNYYDRRVIAGKTGFTTPAGRCLITLAEDNGMQLLIIIMGAQLTFGEDGYSILNYGNFEETIGLMNCLFDSYAPSQILSPDQILAQFPVSDGTGDTYGYVTKSSYSILPMGSDPETLRYEYDLDHGGISAPIRAGEPIGVVRVWYKTKCIAQQELYSKVSVDKKMISKESELPVNPAIPMQREASVWNTALIVVLTVFGIVTLFAVVFYIRNSMIRARNKRRRAMRRREHRECSNGRN